MPQPSTPPVITSLRCRIISVNQHGTPQVAARLSQATCDYTAHGTTGRDTMFNLHDHLTRVHRVDSDDAEYHITRWKEAAEVRIASRLLITEVLAEQGIEVTEDQAKAIVRRLDRKGAPIRPLQQHLGTGWS